MGAPLTMPRATITVDLYHRMGEAGVFPDNEHEELVDGEMIQRPPIGAGHASRVNTIGTLFARRLDDDRALASYQNPNTLPPRKEPQPDIAVLKPAAHRYGTTLPRASDVLLLIKVADTTLSYDRDAKIPIYALNGIPELWLFDVQAKSLIVFRAPVDGVYTKVFTLQKTESIAPLLLSDVSIPVVDLWK